MTHALQPADLSRPPESGARRVRMLRPQALQDAGRRAELVNGFIYDLPALVAESLVRLRWAEIVEPEIPEEESH